MNEDGGNVQNEKNTTTENEAKKPETSEEALKELVETAIAKAFEELKTDDDAATEKVNDLIEKEVAKAMKQADIPNYKLDIELNGKNIKHMSSKEINDNWEHVSKALARR